MTSLLIKAKPQYYLPIIDSIGKRGIHYLWNAENYLIFIDGDENVNKVKLIWDIIKNGIKSYEEFTEES